MSTIKYCKRCLYPSTKPDLWFRDGICGACHAFDDRANYDWKNGSAVLRQIISENKILCGDARGNSDSKGKKKSSEGTNRSPRLNSIDQSQSRRVSARGFLGSLVILQKNSH